MAPEFNLYLQLIQYIYQSPVCKSLAKHTDVKSTDALSILDQVYI